MPSGGRTLVVTKEGSALRICLLEHRQIVEYYHEPLQKDHGVGDIFLGRVTRIQPALNAAFVDIGLEKEGFLHYTDLGLGARNHIAYLRLLRKNPNNIPPLQTLSPEPPTDKNGHIQSLLQVGDWLLVQVSKEMMDTKGPRLTAQISLAGNYVVLLPFENTIGISTRTQQSDKRNALYQKLQPYLVPQYGLIVRTAGLDQPLEVLLEEYTLLQKSWQELLNLLPHVSPPTRLSTDLPKPLAILRDSLAIGIDTLYTDDIEIYQKVKSYCQEQRIPLPLMHLHKKRVPLFIYMGLEKELKQLLGRTVTLPSGGYIVIEKTEALHVIDVNSGIQIQKPSEEAALEVNLQAVQEISRQIRLRDLGGIIIIDFIDQSHPAHRKLIYEQLKKAMEKDRARHAILPMSEFGLIQITRERKRPPILWEEKSLPCPLCEGKGLLPPTIDWERKLHQRILYHLRVTPWATIGIQVTPFFFKALGNKNYQFWKKRWLWIEPSEKLLWGQALIYDLRSGRLLSQI